MSTEHDKLVEDCARAWLEAHKHVCTTEERSGCAHQIVCACDMRAMSAALAIAVEQCAALADEHHGWIEDGQIAAAIRALLSPNDRGQA